MKDPKIELFMQINENNHLFVMLIKKVCYTKDIERKQINRSKL